MRETIKPIIALIIVCSVVTIFLTLTFNFTEGIIAQQGLTEQEKAKKEVLNIAEKFEEIDIREYAKNTPSITNVYKGYSDNQHVGYVFVASVRGYGGNIIVSTGIDNNGKIVGVKIVNHQETQGIGSRITENTFISQFINTNASHFAEDLDADTASGATVEMSDSDIQGISGATVSAQAVNTAVSASSTMYTVLSTTEGG